MRLHGGTADAELVADGGERPIRGEQGQDAGLGRRQESRPAGRFLARRVRLVGNGAVTVRRGRSIRHRPRWLISRCQALARVDPVSSDYPATPPGRLSAAQPRGRRRCRRRPLGRPRTGACSSVRPRLTLAPCRADGRQDRAPALHGRISGMVRCSFRRCRCRCRCRCRRRMPGGAGRHARWAPGDRSVWRAAGAVAS